MSFLVLKSSSGERNSWLLNLYTCCCVPEIVLFLFLAVHWVALWSVIVDLLEGFHTSRTFLVLQQLQNFRRRFGTSKMHLSPPVASAVVHSKAVVLLLLTFCYSHC